MKLSLTRAMLAALYSGKLIEAPTSRDPVFGIDMITKCPGVPDEVLQPRSTWADAEAYDRTAHKLSALFQDNFTTYRDGVSTEVTAAGPHV